MGDGYKRLVDVLWDSVEETEPHFTKDVMLERVRLVHSTEEDAAAFLHKMEAARPPLEQETPVQLIAREVKIEQVTLIALHHARQGMRPDLAWAEGIREVYPTDKVGSQLQHTCPKWAFSILCHRGLVADVAASECPAAEGKSSADFVLAARELLLSDRSLVSRKHDLKRRVFGSPGTPGFRRPNHEVEVLLTLIEAGAAQI